MENSCFSPNMSPNVIDNEKLEAVCPNVIENALGASLTKRSFLHWRENPLQRILPEKMVQKTFLGLIPVQFKPCQCLDNGSIINIL